MQGVDLVATAGAEQQVFFTGETANLGEDGGVISRMAIQFFEEDDEQVRLLLCFFVPRWCLAILRREPVRFAPFTSVSNWLRISRFSGWAAWTILRTRCLR